MLRLWIGLLVAVAALPTTLKAASEAPPELQPRTGSSREVPQLPGYAVPEAPAAPAMAADAVLPGAAAAGSLTISEVRVEGEASTRKAGRHPRALPRWVPEASASGDIALVHNRREPLDAEWVQHQFTANRLVGTPVPFDRIWSLIQLINLAYVTNGYINSGVVIDGSPVSAKGPASDEGALRLHLIYGRLISSPQARSGVAVNWQGRRRGLSHAFVTRRLPSIRAVPLNIKDIERDFRLLADNPAVRAVNIDLRPGERAGEAMLEATVAAQPRADFYLTWGSSRSPSVGGRRFAVGGLLRSLLSSGDQFSAEAGSTSGLKDILASYQTPFFSPRTTFLIRGGYNRAVVIDAPLRPLDIRSRDWYVESGLSREIMARPLTPLGGDGDSWRAARSLRLGVLASHRQVKSFLLGEPFSFNAGSVNGRTEYTALRMTTDYLQRSPDTVLALSATASLGLKGTQSSVAGVPAVATHFTTLLAQANFAHRLGRRRTELRVRLAGQMARGLLYSSERFSVGGRDTVRGYRENFLLADQGVAGSVELAQPVHVLGSDPRMLSDRLATFTLSAFADGAWVRNKRPPQPSPGTLASIGTKIAWNPANWLSAEMSYAKALRRMDAVGAKDLQDRGIAFFVTLRPFAAF